MPLPSTDRRASSEPSGFAGGRRFAPNAFVLAPVLVAALLIAGAWLLAAWLSSSQRTATLDAQTRENANVARALAEHTEQVFVAADRLLMRVANQIEFEPASKLDFPRIARESGVTPDALVHLTFASSDGIVTATSAESDGRPRTRVSVAERDYFVAARDATSKEAYVGRAVLGHDSSRWEIALARRVAGPDGRLAGIVTAAIDPAPLARLFEHIELGRAGAVLMTGLDGHLRAATFGGNDRRYAIDIAQRPHHAATTQAEHGSYVGPIGLDGVARITSFRRLVHYPLVIAVSTGLDDALSAYYRNRATYFSVAGIFTVAVVLVAALFVAGIARLALLTQALRERELHARVANQAKSDFLANVSHDLRTPLTSIRGFSELLERRLPDASHRETAGIIRRASEHLTRLLNDLLDLTKVEAGAMHLTLAPVAIEKLVRDTTDLFRGAADAKRLGLVLDVRPGLPDTAMWDATRVKQILNNLLSNAVKFTEHGGISVTLARAGDRAVVSVADTGPGIPAHLHRRVFEKYGQLDKIADRPEGGTGLGLTLARTFAQLMGGTVTLEDAPGGGARFALILPLAPNAAGEAGALTGAPSWSKAPSARPAAPLATSNACTPQAAVEAVSQGS